LGRLKGKKYPTFQFEEKKRTLPVERGRNNISRRAKLKGRKIAGNGRGNLFFHLEDPRSGKGENCERWPDENSTS